MCTSRNAVVVLFNILLGTSVALCDEGPSVTIIGAGSSGIAAATRLLEHNLTNIRILEAEGRIGGRIHSVKLGSTFVDFGARHCHGQEGNIVYERVKDLDVLSPLNIPSAMYYGRIKLPEPFAVKLTELLSDLLDMPGARNKSQGEYFTSRYNETIVSEFKDNPEYAKLALKAIDVLESHASSLEGAFSWNDAASFQDYEACEGDQGLTWKDTGYRLFLDIMMKKYPDPKQQLPIDDKIFLNKEVTRISWDPTAKNGKVTVRTSDNDTYESDHVIFTPSVGVLKHRSAEMFHPALAEEKSKAIDLIGFDAVMKIVLYFSDIWWEDKAGFFIIWNLDEMDKLRSEFPGGPNVDGRPWFTFIRMVIGHSHNPNVLIAWLTGPVIPHVEQMDESILKDGIHHVLNRTFGDRMQVPKADKVIRTQWYSNPHFRGSYSYQSMRTPTKSDGKSSEQVLAEPILNYKGQPVIQFAGEATNERHFATVHGATETGYREADRLIKLYRSSI